MKTFIFILIVISQGALAGSLKSAATKINSELLGVIYVVGSISITIVSAYFMLGHQNAVAKMTSVIFGLIILGVSGGLLDFMARLT